VEFSVAHKRCKGLECSSLELEGARRVVTTCYHRTMV